MATKTATGWEVISVNDTPNGEAQIWENEVGEQIQLPKGSAPDERTLAMLAISGVTPKLPSDENLHFIEAEDEELDPNEIALGKVLGALTNADSQTGGRVEIRVSKFIDNGKEAFCAKFSAEEFEDQDLELIRQSFGAGRYRIKVMQTTPKTDANGQKIKFGGKMVIAANQIIEIVQPLKPLASDTKNQSQQPDSAMAEMLRLMNEQNRAILEKLSEKKDPMAEMSRMFVLMSQMREAMGGGNKPSDDIFALMEKMEALDDFKKRFKGEEKEPANDLLGMGSKILDMVGELKKNNQPPGAVIPAVQLPSSMATQPQAPEIQENPAQLEMTEEEEMNVAQRMMVNAKLRFLCKLAEKNAPVEQQAEELSGELPDDVINLMLGESWFEQISADDQFPMLRPFKEWFTKLRDEIIRLLKEAGDIDENGKLVPPGEAEDGDES